MGAISWRPCSDGHGGAPTGAGLSGRRDQNCGWCARHSRVHPPHPRLVTEGKEQSCGRRSSGRPGGARRGSGTNGTLHSGAAGCAQDSACPGTGRGAGSSLAAHRHRSSPGPRAGPTGRLAVRTCIRAQLQWRANSYHWIFRTKHKIRF